MAGIERKERERKEADAQARLLEHAAIDVSRHPASVRANGF